MTKSSTAIPVDRLVPETLMQAEDWRVLRWGVWCRGVRVDTTMRHTSHGGRGIRDGINREYAQGARRRETEAGREEQAGTERRHSNRVQIGEGRGN